MEVRIVPDVMRNESKVYLFNCLPDGVREFYRADGSMYIEKPSDQAKDEDIVFCHLPIKAEKPLVDELNRLGIKSDNDHKIAGTLDATKAHLEDMRALVFNGKSNAKA